MTPDDLEALRAYERARMAATRAAAAVLDDLLVPADGGPVIRLLCPRAHPLVQVRVEHDGDEWHLDVVGDRARAGGAVTRTQTPIRRARSLCRHPGCPRGVEREGWCPDHGDREAEVIDAMKTGFTCRSPRCRWSGAVTTAELMQRYAAAVAAGRPSAAVTGEGDGRAVR